MNYVLSMSKLPLYKYLIYKIDGAKMSDTHINSGINGWSLRHFFEFMCVDEHQSSDKKELS